MPTQFPGIFAALAAPFDPREVRTRSQGGRTLSYITARTAMTRFDLVLGPESWQDELIIISENSFLCKITITLPDGTKITKSDVGGMAGMSDAGDDDKSGASDAFKRCAVKFGVGRVLYRDGVPDFTTNMLSYPEASDGNQGSTYQPAQSRPQAPPSPPQSPQQRYPNNDPARSTQQSRTAPSKPFDGPPRNGKGLFAWIKDQEKKYEASNFKLLMPLNDWAKKQKFPGRMVDWDAGQVNQAYAEALGMIESVEGPTVTQAESEDDDIPF